MPTPANRIQSPRNSLVISDAIDIYLSSEEEGELFRNLNSKRQQLIKEEIYDQDISSIDEENIKSFKDDVQSSGKANALSDPNNPAQDVVENLQSNNSNPGKLVAEQAAEISGGNPDVIQEKLQESLVKEDAVASNAIDQENNPRTRWTKKQWAAAVGGIVGILGLAACLYSYLKPDENKTEPEKLLANRTQSNSPTDFAITAEASQTFISLLMQAASNAPYNSLAFKDFGISESTYQGLRGQLVAHRDNITEDDHWQIMAQQAETIFPPTGKTYTLGDHMLALEIQFNLLEPMYDAQPLDLDLDTTISALADHIDLNAEIPIQKLYNTMLEIVPDTSGANRLQRLILARMAIARAIAKAQPSV